MLRRLDIRKDLSAEQLAWIGAVAIAYNHTEAMIGRMLSVVTQLPPDLQLELESRINGIDNKIAIVKRGAEKLKIPEKIRVFLSESVGEGAFMLLKKYRDVVIHARILDASRGTGETLESKGRHTEVLLTANALNGLFDRLDLLREELTELYVIFTRARLIGSLGAGHPERGPLEAETQAHLAQAQEHRTRRLSLPPLPEFPPEEELRALGSPVQQAQQVGLTGYFQPAEQSNPVQPILRSGLYEDRPHPPAGPTGSVK
jgi:hypothetical protein